MTMTDETPVSAASEPAKPPPTLAAHVLKAANEGSYETALSRCLLAIRESSPTVEDLREGFRLALAEPWRPIMAEPIETMTEAQLMFALSLAASFWSLGFHAAKGVR